MLTRYQYDSLNRVTATVRAAGTSAAVTVQTYYDKAGNVTQVTDERGKPTQFEYDDVAGASPPSTP